MPRTVLNLQNAQAAQEHEHQPRIDPKKRRFKLKTKMRTKFKARARSSRNWETRNSLLFKVKELISEDFLSRACRERREPAHIKHTWSLHEIQTNFHVRVGGKISCFLRLSQLQLGSRLRKQFNNDKNLHKNVLKLANKYDKLALFA